MARVELIERIRRGLFFLDGAMGTLLIAGGVEPGTCNDYLNITSPEAVGSVHAAYFAAGSDAVITNTPPAKISMFSAILGLAAIFLSRWVR